MDANHKDEGGEEWKVIQWQSHVQMHGNSLSRHDHLARRAPQFLKDDSDSERPNSGGGTTISRRCCRQISGHGDDFNRPPVRDWRCATLRSVHALRRIPYAVTTAYPILPIIVGRLLLRNESKLRVAMNIESVKERGSVVGYTSKLG
jgi:hypothetical protein